MAQCTFQRLPSPSSASRSPTASTSSTSSTPASVDSSSSSNTYNYDTNSSNSSSYKRARVPELPPTVAWLEHATLDMTASASKKFANCTTAFKLQVTYRDAAASQQSLAWHVTRSFEEYLEFQQRLLKTLTLGHACSAECKWLHSFVKNYFPKKARFFGNCSTRTMNVRREKLTRCLNVLKASLLNRGNHGCAIVVLQLAGEFDAFVHGNTRFALAPSVRRARSASSDDDELDESEKVRRCSIGSSVSTSSTEAGDHEQHMGDLENVCDLCDSSLDERPDVSALDAASVFSCHTTTLSCGHQFHDECVLPELAALNYCCPSCNAPQAVEH